MDFYTSCIKDIDLTSDLSDKIFLTFDIDWAVDNVLSYSIDLVEKFDIKVTWFVTHDTPLLDRLRENPKFELGIHPNFNFLMQGKHDKGENYKEVIDNILRIVPEAVSVRSHSMTQNSPMLDYFTECGLTHDSNHFIPHDSGLVLQPWKIWNGLIKCPYFWEDDVAFLEKDLKILNTINNGGLKIYDFHPIHVFLNTENPTRYQSTRAVHRNKELSEHRYDGLGTRNLLEQLVSKCK